MRCLYGAFDVDMLDNKDVICRDVLSRDAEAEADMWMISSVLWKSGDIVDACEAFGKNEEPTEKRTDINLLESHFGATSGDGVMKRSRWQHRWFIYPLF
jgi:hypothetical protein